MSYRKVSEGGQSFDHSGSMIIGNPFETGEDNIGNSQTEEEKYYQMNGDMPMTYQVCPVCYKSGLMTTNSHPIIYYKCVNCGWNNIPLIPHSHPNDMFVNNKGNVNNNSLLARAIRK